MSRNASAKKPRFICEVCEAEVPLEAASCPNCGQFFAATLCPNCGFSGEAALFGNGCPSCGYRIDGGKAPPSKGPSPAPSFTQREGRGAKRRGRQMGPSHISYYLLALAVFVALAAALIFNMF